MSDPIISFTRLKHGSVTLLVVGTLVLGACGTGGSDGSSDAGRTTRSATSKRTDRSSTSGNVKNDTVLSGKINALVPIDAEASDGFRMVRAECEATEAEKKPDADGLSERFQPVVFAVPEAWKSRGGGSGGSGSALGTGYRMDFDNEARERITVEYDWDAYDTEGRVVSSDNKPWEAFDYDITVGDSKVRITFDRVATLKVGDQKVDLFYLDPEQSPKHVRGEEYRARVSVLEVSKSKEQPAKLRERSFVVKVTFKSDAAFTQDDVAAVVSSVNLPECTWDEIVEDQEVMYQMDLEGDGKFTTTEEHQRQLQEKLADLQKNLDDKTNKSDE